MDAVLVGHTNPPKFSLMGARPQFRVECDLHTLGISGEPIWDARHESREIGPPVADLCRLGSPTLRALGFPADSTTHDKRPTRPISAVSKSLRHVQEWLH